MKWLAFPSSKSPKLLIGSGDSLSNALNLYRPSSFKGKLSRSILKYLPDVFAQHLLQPYDEIQYTDNLISSISNIPNTQNHVLSVSVGTPGPHQKQTIQITVKNKIIAYAKLGKTPEAATLIRSEYKQLQQLQTMNLQSAMIPEVLHFEESESHTLLSQSAPNSPGKQRSLDIDKSDLRFLCELSQQHASPEPVQNIITSTGWESIKNNIDFSSDSQWNTWENVVRYLNEQFSDKAVQTCFCHGDYAPWNTLNTTGNRLYIFDWEYADNNTPVFNDLFHSLFMPVRLVKNRKPEYTVRMLLSAYDSTLFKDLVSYNNVKQDEMPQYILLYLLKQMARENNNQQSPDEYLTTCAHILLLSQGYKAERKRILVGAYACEPDQGSEPSVGWNMTSAICNNHDAWVITRKNNRPSIEKELASNPNPHMHFAYTDLPGWASFWKKGGRGIRLYYYLWQMFALKEARKLHRQKRFDLAHHLTFVNDYMYTFLAFLPIPFVWGPVGSNSKWPAQLAPNKKAYYKDTFRFYTQALIRAMDPLYWLSVKRAKLILGIHQRIGNHLPLRIFAKDKFLVHSAIGVEEDAISDKARQENKQPYTILTMGKMLPIKGFKLSLHAFAHCVKTIPDAKFIIVGKGPEKPSIEKLIEELGIGENIEMIDWMPREDALAIMKKADVFLYPSFEGSGMVTLEAMANGLPVVSLDFGGAGEMVDSASGIKITPENFNDTTKNLGEALVKLYNEEGLRKSMGSSAIKRIRNRYLWENRYKNISEWYDIATTNHTNII